MRFPLPTFTLSRAGLPACLITAVTLSAAPVQASNIDILFLVNQNVSDPNANPDTTLDHVGFVHDLTRELTTQLTAAGFTGNQRFGAVGYNANGSTMRSPPRSYNFGDADCSDAAGWCDHIPGNMINTLTEHETNGLSRHPGNIDKSWAEDADAFLDALFPSYATDEQGAFGERGTGDGGSALGTLALFNAIDEYWDGEDLAGRTQARMVIKIGGDGAGSTAISHRLRSYGVGYSQMHLTDQFFRVEGGDDAEMCMDEFPSVFPGGPPPFCLDEVPNSPQILVTDGTHDGTQVYDADAPNNYRQLAANSDLYLEYGGFQVSPSLFPHNLLFGLPLHDYPSDFLEDTDGDGDVDDDDDTEFQRTPDHNDHEGVEPQGTTGCLGALNMYEYDLEGSREALADVVAQCLTRQAENLIAAPGETTGLPRLPEYDLSIAEGCSENAPVRHPITGECEAYGSEAYPCLEGEVLVDNVCETVQTCPAGTMLHRETNSCVGMAAGTPTCPDNEVWNGVMCVARTTCSSGQFYEVHSNTCGATECESDEIRVNGTCQDLAMCPEGEIVYPATNTCGPPPGGPTTTTTVATDPLFLNAYWDTAEVMMRATFDQLAQIESAGRFGSSDKMLAASGIMGMKSVDGYLSLRYMDGDFSRESNNKKIDYDGYSIVIGGHKHYATKSGGRGKFGIALSYHALESDIGEPGTAGPTLGTLEADGYGLTLYGERESESRYYTKMQLHGAVNEYDQERVDADDAAMIHLASPDGYSAKARIEGGRRMLFRLNTGELQLTPFAAVEGTYYRIDRFDEEGDDGVSVEALDDARAALQAGAELEFSRSRRGRTSYIATRVMGEIGITSDDPVDATYVAGDTRTQTQYAPLEDERVGVSLSAGVKSAGGTEAFIRFNGDFSSEDTQRSVAVGLSVPF